MGCSFSKPLETETHQNADTQNNHQNDEHGFLKHWSPKKRSPKKGVATSYFKQQVHLPVSRTQEQEEEEKDLNELVNPDNVMLETDFDKNKQGVNVETKGIDVENSNGGGDVCTDQQKNRYEIYISHMKGRGSVFRHTSLEFYLEFNWNGTIKRSNLVQGNSSNSSGGRSCLWDSVLHYDYSAPLVKSCKIVEDNTDTKLLLNEDDDDDDEDKLIISLYCKRRHHIREDEIINIGNAQVKLETVLSAPLHHVFTLDCVKNVTLPTISSPNHNVGSTSTDSAIRISYNCRITQFAQWDLKINKIDLVYHMNEKSESAGVGGENDESPKQLNVSTSLLQLEDTKEAKELKKKDFVQDNTKRFVLRYKLHNPDYEDPKVFQSLGGKFPTVDAIGYTFKASFEQDVLPKISESKQTRFRSFLAGTIGFQAYQIRWDETTCTPLVKQNDKNNSRAVKTPPKQTSMEQTDARLRKVDSFVLNSDDGNLLGECWVPIEQLFELAQAKLRELIENGQQKSNCECDQTGKHAVNIIFEKELRVFGKRVGSLKCDMCFTKLPATVQLGHGVLTENGISHISPVVLYEDEERPSLFQKLIGGFGSNNDSQILNSPSCKRLIQAIASLEKSLKGNTRKLTKSKNDMESGHKEQVRACKELYSILLESEKESIVSFVYKTPYELFRMQQTLLGLWELIVGWMDAVTYTTRLSFFHCLTALLMRGELSEFMVPRLLKDYRAKRKDNGNVDSNLSVHGIYSQNSGGSSGSTGNNNNSNNNNNNSNGNSSELLHHKVKPAEVEQFCFNYRGLCYRTLSWALFKLSLKGSFVELRVFCARVVAIMTFRLPKFGALVYQAIIPENETTIKEWNTSAELKEVLVGKKYTHPEWNAGWYTLDTPSSAVNKTDKSNTKNLILEKKKAKSSVDVISDKKHEEIKKSSKSGSKSAKVNKRKFLSHSKSTKSISSVEKHGSSSSLIKLKRRFHSQTNNNSKNDFSQNKIDNDEEDEEEGDNDGKTNKEEENNGERILDWKVFHRSLEKVYSRQELEKQESALPMGTKQSGKIQPPMWLRRIQKHGHFFFLVSQEWIKYVLNTTAQLATSCTENFEGRTFRSGIQFHKISGYKIFLRAFLLELRRRDIKEIPESMRKLSMFFLVDPNLLTPFISLIVPKTNLYDLENVTAGIDLISAWLTTLHGWPGRFIASKLIRSQGPLSPQQMNQLMQKEQSYYFATMEQTKKEKLDRDLKALNDDVSIVMNHTEGGRSDSSSIEASPPPSMLAQLRASGSLSSLHTSASGGTSSNVEILTNSISEEYVGAWEFDAVCVYFPHLDVVRRKFKKAISKRIIGELGITENNDRSKCNWYSHLYADIPPVLPSTFDFKLLTHSLWHLFHAQHFQIVLKTIEMVYNHWNTFPVHFQNRIRQMMLTRNGNPFTFSSSSSPNEEGSLDKQEEQQEDMRNTTSSSDEMESDCLFLTLFYHWQEEVRHFFQTLLAFRLCRGRKSPVMEKLLAYVRISLSSTTPVVWNLIWEDSNNKSKHDDSMNDVQLIENQFLFGKTLCKQFEIETEKAQQSRLSSFFAPILDDSSSNMNSDLNILKAQSLKIVEHTRKKVLLNDNNNKTTDENQHEKDGELLLLDQVKMDMELLDENRWPMKFRPYAVPAVTKFKSVWIKGMDPKIPSPHLEWNVVVMDQGEMRAVGGITHFHPEM